MPISEGPRILKSNLKGMAAGQSENPALVAIKKLIKSSWRGKLDSFVSNSLSKHNPFGRKFVLDFLTTVFKGQEGMADLEMWEMN